MLEGQAISGAGGFNAIVPPNVRRDVDGGPRLDSTFAFVYETALQLIDERRAAFDSMDGYADANGEMGIVDLDNLLLNANKDGLASQGLGSGARPACDLSNSRFRFAGSEVVSHGDGGRGPIPGSDPSLPTTTDGVDKAQLSQWMDTHARARSSHQCALYCRLGLEAAGINTADRPRSGDAGDYGPFLLRHGAQVIPQSDYIPQTGDVVVFDKTAEHPSGHIETFDGRRWVSDFVQLGFSPYGDAGNTPKYTIYRLS
jgi:hypothetical protein